MIDLHPTSKISPLADIEDSQRGTKIVLGPGVIIDSFVKIKPAGGVGAISIGRDTVINSGCVLYTGNGISIGEDVAIAANCTLAPVNHEYSSKVFTIRSQGFRPSKGGILIEDDVWIGAGSVILDGAVLRRGCVIGSMSLVRGEIAAYSIQAGNPLRSIGCRR